MTATAAGVPAVVTLNADTLAQDFSEAALVVSSLGEPGAPMRVIRGQMQGPPWVTLETLQQVRSNADAWRADKMPPRAYAA